MQLCTRAPLILTAHSESESVCKMSSMVFNTRPLHSRWGNLAEKNQQGGESGGTRLQSQQDQARL